jgi:hypothetical protein
MPQTMNFESNELVKRLQELPEREKAFFFDTFFEIWGGNGFGTLSKKEIELLIFSLMEKTLGNLRPYSIYEWAKILKLTAGKIKNLKLESYLKYYSLLNREVDIAQTIKKFFSRTELVHFDISAENTKLDSGQVRILIEDPVILFEFDRIFKNLNGIYEIDRKGEVASMSVKDFLRLINAVSGDEEDGVIKKLAELSNSENTKLDAVKSEMKKISYRNQSDGAKLIQFLELLGNTFAEKPTKLLKHLKLIFESQK